MLATMCVGLSRMQFLHAMNPATHGHTSLSIAMG